jgi:hypothetical protein
MLSFNNSDGRLPFVSQDEFGKFEMPVELLWQEGLALSSLFKLPSDPWILVKGNFKKFDNEEFQFLQSPGTRFKYFGSGTKTITFSVVGARFVFTKKT